MNTRSRILLAFVLGSAVGVFAGCQTYDFEPVEPLALAKYEKKTKVIARQAKPNIMLLVDKSGSMHEPINATDSSCTGCGSGVPKCTASCVTRWRALESAMGTFLTNPTSAAVARFGLAYFPNAPRKPQNADQSCTNGGVVQSLGITPSNDVDSELIAHAAAINNHIQTLDEEDVVGGTPTGNSIAIVGNTAELVTDSREDFILLLTDGLPNCNKALDDSSCTCVNTPGGAPPCGDPEPGGGRQCLDDTATVNFINSVKGRGIRVIVVGFGADTGAGLAFAPLNKLAEAGGMARNCLDDQGQRNPALCGAGDTCGDLPAALCSTRFYKAADAAQLTAALQRISLLVGQDVCEFTLDSVPSDPRLLSVEVNGTNIPGSATTWTLAGNQLTFVETGDVCPQIRNATPQNPVDVNISVVEAL